MQELQLVKVQQKIPMLFDGIYNAIQGEYRETEVKTRAMRSDPLVNKKIGYLLHTYMEHKIRCAIEEMDINNTELFVESNGRGAPYLVVKTPFCLLTFSRVRHAGDVPRKAHYRQKYIDQMFMQDILPEYELFTSECKPLYVITYAETTQGSFIADIRIGRLTVDQSGWSCNYHLSDLINPVTEKISVNNNIKPDEEVKRNSRIRIKKHS